MDDDEPRDDADELLAESSAWSARPHGPDEDCSMIADEDQHDSERLVEAGMEQHDAPDSRVGWSGGASEVEVDHQLRQEILSRLEEEGVPLADIGIMVQRRVVTVCGTSDNEALRTRLEDFISAVPGVDEVRNLVKNEFDDDADAPADSDRADEGDEEALPPMTPYLPERAGDVWRAGPTSPSSSPEHIPT